MSYSLFPYIPIYFSNLSKNFLCWVNFFFSDFVLSNFGYILLNDLSVHKFLCKKPAYAFFYENFSLESNYDFVSQKAKLLQWLSVLNIFYGRGTERRYPLSLLQRDDEEDIFLIFVEKRVFKIFKLMRT